MESTWKKMTTLIFIGTVAWKEVTTINFIGTVNTSAITYLSFLHILIRDTLGSLILF